MSPETQDTSAKKPHKKERFDWRPYRKQAKPILKQLGETEIFAARQIERLILHCGIEVAEKLLVETLRIEAEGGLLTLDGTRRRTPGGTFFKLAKERLTEEERRLVFPYRYVTNADRKKLIQKAIDRQVRAEQRAKKRQLKIQKKVEKKHAKLSPEVQLLFDQANDLRRKIAERESAGGGGVKMLQSMLQKVEQQIEQAIQ